MCVFGEISKESEGMESSGGKEMWFVNGMLPSTELAEKVVCGLPGGSRNERGVWQTATLEL